MQERETRLLMLVDDEPAQCRLVSAIASRAGWRTVFARDAETAIAMLGTHQRIGNEAGRFHHKAKIIADLRRIFCVLGDVQWSVKTAIHTDRAKEWMLCIGGKAVAGQIGCGVFTIPYQSGPAWVIPG